MTTAPVPYLTPGPCCYFRSCRSRLPLRPRHVPAVEPVVRGDRRILGVLHDDHVADHRVVEEPGGRDAAVVAALDVAQTDAAVAGVVVAEGVAAPVVAVDEGAGGGQADGVRDVLDVVLAAVADRVAVHPGHRELLAHDHLAVPGLVAGLAGGDRNRLDD